LGSLKVSPFGVNGSLASLAFTGMQRALFSFNLIEPDDNFYFGDFLFKYGLLLLKIAFVLLDNFMKGFGQFDLL
jgi:hypothetical protein